MIENILDRYRKTALRIIDLVCAVAEISGIYDPEKMLDKFSYFLFIGITEKLNCIDILTAVVIVEEHLDDIIDLFLLDLIVHFRPLSFADMLYFYLFYNTK
jgi:hypothetical protein